MGKDETRTGGTLILTTSCAYDLSYKQFPSKFPKFRRVRLSASVIASFLHYQRGKKGGYTSTCRSLDLPTKNKMTSSAHLVKRSRLALAVLQYTIPDIFVVRPISERHPHDGRHADVVPFRLLAEIDEIGRDVHDAGAPAVEPKHLVGEINDLPSFGIGEFGTATWTGSLADEFRSEFFVQFGLESGDLFRCGAVFGERGGAK